VTCAILIPSLDRPQRLAETIETIHRNTPLPHRLLFCVSDEYSMEILTERGEWFLNDADDPDRRYVTRMNKLVRYIGDADTVFFGSDDVIHQPNWLEEGLKVLDDFAVVVVNDLHNPNGTQALMRADYLLKAVIDAPGDAFHHGYHHNFADNEQHFTAYKHGEYGRAMDSHVEHLHPLFQAANSIPWDRTYSQAQAGWDHDEALFRSRMTMIDTLIGPTV